MPDSRHAGKHCFREAMFCLGVLLPGHDGYARTMEFTPSLEVAETYTDNVRLAPSGLKEEDYVTQITPGLVLRTAGGRLEAEAVYRLENIFYATTDGADSSYHLFQGNATANVVDDTFFIDAEASIGRQNVLFTGPLALDNLSVTGNRENVATVSASPYVRRTFHTMASVEVRDTWNRVEYDGGNLYDSESNTVSAAINSGPYFRDVSWHVDYSAESVRYSHLVDADNDFESVSADIRYRVTARATLVGKAGYENNAYPASSLREQPDGSFWSVEASWEPAPRTHIEGALGNRFYGTTHELLFRHEMRRSSLEASYTEEVTSVRNLQLERRVFSPINPLTGEPFMNESGELPLLLEMQIPTISEEIFVRKRTQGAWHTLTGKSAIDIDLYGERRDYQKIPGRERSDGADVTWTWQFSGRTRLIARLGLQETDFRDGVRKDTMELWSVGASRIIMKRMEGSADFRHMAVDSSVSSAGYDENRFVFRLNMRF